MDDFKKIRSTCYNSCARQVDEQDHSDDLREPILEPNPIVQLQKCQKYQQHQNRSHGPEHSFTRESDEPERNNNTRNGTSLSPSWKSRLWTNLLDDSAVTSRNGNSTSATRTKSCLQITVYLSNFLHHEANIKSIKKSNLRTHLYSICRKCNKTQAPSQTSLSSHVAILKPQ